MWRSGMISFPTSGELDKASKDGWFALCRPDEMLAFVPVVSSTQASKISHPVKVRKGMDRACALVKEQLNVDVSPA